MPDFFVETFFDVLFLVRTPPLPPRHAAHRAHSAAHDSASTAGSRAGRSGVAAAAGIYWRACCPGCCMGLGALPGVLPVAREPTRWEKFAKAKGIVKQKRSKMVWDEEKQVSPDVARAASALDAMGQARSVEHPPSRP